MTEKPQKPKFNKTVCLHCGVNKAVDIARAYEQGKREGAKAFREWVKEHGYAVGDKRYIAFDKEELEAELEGRK